LRFDSTKELTGLPLSQDYKNGIKIRSKQIELDIKRIGNNWQETLKEVLQGAVTNT